MGHIIDRVRLRRAHVNVMLRRRAELEQERQGVEALRDARPYRVRCAPLQREVSVDDTWFAWYPVRTGALGTGRVVWLQRVWRNRCMGATIYQPMEKDDG